MSESNLLMLRRGKNVLLRHSEDRPFATAVRQEKTYTASRGTVKTAVREAERIPLTAVKQEGDSVPDFQHAPEERFTGEIPHVFRSVRAGRRHPEIPGSPGFPFSVYPFGFFQRRVQRRVHDAARG